jgi:hypothetical protein
MQRAAYGNSLKTRENMHLRTGTEENSNPPLPSAWFSLRNCTGRPGPSLCVGARKPDKSPIVSAGSFLTVGR